jgi:hypothetical protein
VTLALRDLQEAMAAYLTSGDEAGIVGSVASDSIPADARLRIHRHHLHESLASVLTTTFPTVRQLVGEAFFRAMAHAFVAANLPVQPVLSEYGEGFAAFIDRYDRARGLPYLGDVARLDWALNVAFHNPWQSRLTAADLAAIPAEQLPSARIGLAPGTAVIRSIHPLDRIWAASQPGASSATVDLDAGGTSLLVFRQRDDSGFVALRAGEAAFASSLLANASLEDAAVAAFAADAGFDLSVIFRRLLDLTVLVALQQ